MIMINDTLVTAEVVEEYFLCNLNACKGACCWEGDFGAPLEKEELAILDEVYPKVKPFLSAEGRTAIDRDGTYTYVKQVKEYGTTLIDNGACAFMTYDQQGIAQCGIEQAYNAGEIDFKKPVSCHLYPIRIERNEQSGIDILQYDRWDICSAACSLGEKQQLPLYRFVKDALIRKYGADYYETLEGAVRYRKAGGK